MNEGFFGWPKGGCGPVLPYVTGYLTAQVTMVTANVWYDGPAVTLRPGTWLLLGAITIQPNSTRTDIELKLWDGVTAFASAELPREDLDTTPQSTALSAIVTPTATTTYKISAVNDSSDNSKILPTTQFHPSGNTASYLLAIKIG